MLPFNCAINLNEWEQLTIDAFTEIESEIDSIIEDAYKFDRFGKKTKGANKWLYAHDFISLFIYATITKMQIDRDRANDDMSTAEEYYETYQLQCIIDRFNCNGFDITNFLRKFALSKDTIAQANGVGYDNITQGDPIQQVY